MRLTALILLSLLIPPFLAGQASYEGQAVGAVDLASAPSIDVDNLRPLVEIKPGQPYSENKIQDSVQALKKTGRFKSVAVEVKPETSGLRVIFVLEPAYYYGVVSFPGSRSFSRRSP